MANEVQTPSEARITVLVKGIVNDVGDLIKQQFQFARAEVKHDLRQTGQASALLAVGVGIAFFGALLLCLMLVHLLHWATLPPEAVTAGLPLWACYGIVGVVILAVSGSLVYAGKKKFDSFNPLPDQTVQSLKENIQWATSSRTSAAR